MIMMMLRVITTMVNIQKKMNKWSLWTWDDDDDDSDDDDDYDDDDDDDDYDDDNGEYTEGNE